MLRDYLYSISLMDINRLLTKFYFVSLLFFYPYGVALFGDNNVRITDLLAIPSILISVFILVLSKQVAHYSILGSIVLIFILMEITLPLMGFFSGIEGLGALSNSFRMALIWLPFFLFIITNNFDEFPKFDSFINYVLRYAILINLFYGVIQLAVKAKLLPRSFLITELLIPYTVDDHFRVTDGFRASGFFTNTSTLSIFGILCVVYFVSRYLKFKKVSDSLFIFISLTVLLITLSRAAFISVIPTFVVAWFFLNSRLKVISIIAFFSFVVIIYLLVDYYVGVDVLFRRVFFLFENNAVEDSSFSKRFYTIWPRALQRLEAYPFGTLVSPTTKIGLIDSGYITYYAQGKIFSLLILVGFLGVLFYQGMKCFFKSDQWTRIMLLGIIIYIIGTMVVLIPLKSPLIIFFILFAVWGIDGQEVKSNQSTL